MPKGTISGTALLSTGTILQAGWVHQTYFVMFIQRMDVRFKLRYNPNTPTSQRPTTQAAIYCRIFIGTDYATDFSTRQVVQPRNFDQKGDIALPDDSNGGLPVADAINRALALIRHRVTVIYNRYDYDNEPITAQELRNEYLSSLKKPTLLWDMIDAFLAAEKERVVEEDEASQADKKKTFITQSTYERYEDYTLNLKSYLTDTGQKQFPLGRISEDWLDTYQQRLHERYDINYAAKHVFLLKRIARWAKRAKYIRINPIADYIPAADHDPRPLVFLMPDELTRLETTDFATLPVYRTIAARLDRCRDAFLAMHEIGQHYTDYVKFVRQPDRFLHHAGGYDFFKKSRQKSGVAALVAVSDRLSGLINKYGGAGNLPTFSNSKFNDYLKLIAVACGIDKNLTTKAARKTFADGHLNEQGTDADSVRTMMGLTTGSRSLDHYGRIDERRLIRQGLVPKKSNKSKNE